MTEKTEKKRGRPQKTKREPTEPIVTDKADNLVMSEGTKHPKQNITMKDVQQNLHAFYTKVLGQSNSNISFSNSFGNIDNPFNPFLQNARLKKMSSTPTHFAKEDLVAALQNPQNSEEMLRAAGWGLSSSQYLYYKILRLAADVPMYLYYKMPEFLEAEQYKSKEFKNEDVFVDEWLTAFDVVNTFKRIALEVKREGKATYVLRNKVSHGDGGKKIVQYCALQKLPSSHVKLTAIGSRGYIASFNMMLFTQPGYSPSQYPQFIQDVWASMQNEKVFSVNRQGQTIINYNILNKMNFQDSNGGVYKGILEKSKNNSYMYWVQLPQDLCYTFSSDNSHAWDIPDTAGLFLNLQELTDYQTLAGLIASTPLTAVLTGEVELVNDPNPGADQTALNPQTIMGFQNQLNQMTSSNVQSVFMPFKNLKLQSLPNIPNSNEIVTRAVQNFLSLAGEGGIIAASDKPSVAQVKGAQLLEEAQQDYVTKQFQAILNLIVNKILGCAFKWKIVLWGGIFTFDADLKRTKEMFQGGATFLLPRIASAYGLTLRDVKATDSYINSLGIYADFKTLTQEVQAKKAQQAINKSTVGRPATDDNDIDNDNTAASTDQGTNTVDMKDFAADMYEQGCCLICGEPVDSGVLCDHCKAEFEMEE